MVLRFGFPGSQVSVAPPAKFAAGDYPALLSQSITSRVSAVLHLCDSGWAFASFPASGHCEPCCCEHGARSLGEHTRRVLPGASKDGIESISHELAKILSSICSFSLGELLSIGFCGVEIYKGGFSLRECECLMMFFFDLFFQHPESITTLTV